MAAIWGTVLATVLAPASAWADKRVALVVGNASYQTVPKLPNPSRDASSVAKMFRDAGLKVGVCIRPSKIFEWPKDKPIPNYAGRLFHTQVEDHVGEMADKIAYAKKRWGCTIFYMDTNVKWALTDPSDLSRGMWQGDAHVLPCRWSTNNGALQHRRRD